MSLCHLLLALRPTVRPQSLGGERVVRLENEHNRDPEGEPIGSGRRALRLRAPEPVQAQSCRSCASTAIFITMHEGGYDHSGFIQPVDLTSSASVSRAMENCPLGVTRNCPLLG
jgi:ferredoxin